jgi:ornithine cyclodeaminase/alanine dehydrogenase-like protein (mu-crystallin family)
VSAPAFYQAASIRRAVELSDLIDPVALAFADYSRGLGEAPIVVFAPAGPDGDVHVKGAWMAGREVFTVKVATRFTARATRGVGAGSGFVAVHSATTGDLLALLQDEHHLTDLRTAAAGAVATRLLARADATTLAVLGTGVQARLQTLAARTVRPVRTVLIWGRRAEAADALRAALLAEAPEVQVAVAADARAAVREADIVVTATASTEPIVHGSWLHPGQHVTAIGADDETKAELDALCFRRADVLAVDSRTEALRYAGDLRRAIEARTITPADIHAELGELVDNPALARRTPTQITVAKLIGLGVQDLVAAELALRRLPEEELVR